MEKVSLLGLLIFTFFAQSCKKKGECETIIFCPSQNTAINKVVGNDTVRLYIPNCFTPNYDGINDRFQCFGRNISSFECKIYEGTTLVLTVNSLDNYWDGRVNGEIKLKRYSLQVKTTTVTGEIIALTGTVSLAGGEFFGEIYPEPTVDYNTHVIWKLENAQFPIQNNNGIFDVNLPTGEYLSGDNEINKCGII